MNQLHTCTCLARIRKLSKQIQRKMCKLIAYTGTISLKLKAFGYSNAQTHILTKFSLFDSFKSLSKRISFGDSQNHNCLRKELISFHGLYWAKPRTFVYSVIKITSWRAWQPCISSSLTNKLPYSDSQKPNCLRTQAHGLWWTKPSREYFLHDNPVFLCKENNSSQKAM